VAEGGARHELAGDEIHVWRAALDLPAETVARLGETLSADERERAARFRIERVRRRYVVARGLLRTVLGRYLGRPPEELRFEYGTNGKPALAPGEDGGLRFNVSHSDDLGVFAVARGREIGVDVERLRPVPRAEQIAERFFSLPERVAFRGVPAERKVEAFFTCWTRKEAYIKARGEGLSHPLDQFAVSLVPGEPARLWPAGDGDGSEVTHWSLEALPPWPGYVAALAGRGHGWRLASRAWPLHP